MISLTEDAETSLIRAESALLPIEVKKNKLGHVSRRQVKDAENKLIKYLVDHQSLACEAIVDNPEVFISTIKEFMNVGDIRTKHPEIIKSSYAVCYGLMKTAKSEKVRADMAKHLMAVTGHGPVTKNITVGTTIDPTQLNRADIFGATKGLLETFRGLKSAGSNRTD
jgi:hypothetical protein